MKEKILFSYSDQEKRVKLKFPNEKSYQMFIDTFGESIKFKNEDESVIADFDDSDEESDEDSEDDNDNDLLSKEGEDWYIKDDARLTLYLFASIEEYKKNQVTLKFPNTILIDKFKRQMILLNYLHLF